MGLLMKHSKFRLRREVMTISRLLYLLIGGLLGLNNNRHIMRFGRSWTEKRLLLLHRKLGITPLVGFLWLC